MRTHPHFLLCLIVVSTVTIASPAVRQKAPSPAKQAKPGESLILFGQDFSDLLSSLDSDSFTERSRARSKFVERIKASLSELDSHVDKGEPIHVYQQVTTAVRTLQARMRNAGYSAEVKASLAGMVDLMNTHVANRRLKALFALETWSLEALSKQPAARFTEEIGLAFQRWKVENIALDLALLRGELDWIARLTGQVDKIDEAIQALMRRMKKGEDADSGKAPDGPVEDTNSEELRNTKQILENTIRRVNDQASARYDEVITPLLLEFALAHGADPESFNSQWRIVGDETVTTFHVPDKGDVRLAFSMWRDSLSVSITRDRDDASHLFDIDLMASGPLALGYAAYDPDGRLLAAVVAHQRGSEPYWMRMDRFVLQTPDRTPRTRYLEMKHAAGRFDLACVTRSLENARDLTHRRRNPFETLALDPEPSAPEVFLGDAVLETLLKIR